MIFKQSYDGENQYIIKYLPGTKIIKVPNEENSVNSCYFFFIKNKKKKLFFKIKDVFFKKAKQQINTNNVLIYGPYRDPKDEKEEWVFSLSKTRSPTT